jgi:hypothetical protein
MTRTQRTALVCLLLSCGVSVFLGFYLERNMHDVMLDFKGIYYGTRCLFQHADPYKPGEPLRAYMADGERLLPNEDGLRQNLTWDVYFPAASIFIAPFAMLPWGTAHLLWISFTAGSLIFAAFLIWNSGADSAPIISVGLICLILANSEILFLLGNTAGIVVSLCVVAVWCFLRERFIWAGILCLAFSLAIKPHDAGLVWLYFLLAGGIYRKRALQTLLATTVLAVLAILWVAPIAPHWMQELHSNILTACGLNDPVFASAVRIGPCMIINLQSAIYIFRDDPRVYNLVSYLVCGALLLVWSVSTLRSRFSQRRAWLALAAVVPLTLLVTYHRPYDAKLLLLTVPACALLWSEGKPIRWIALLVTTAGIVSTADIPLTILLTLTRNLHISTVALSGQLLTVLLMRPIPLILLAMAIFYLWLYMRHAPEKGLP